MITTDKFVEHAALIVLQDGISVGEARFRAWCEGPEGYANRLTKGKNYHD